MTSNNPLGVSKRFDKKLPIVAFIGRPSVGKSTLFNRILKKARTLTDQQMGVTRDRIMEDFSWNSKDFTLMDTGGIAPEASAIQNQVSLQSEIALSIADLIVYMVDTKIGPTKEDIYVAKLLRNERDKVLLVANKADNKDWAEFNFNVLGFGEPFFISATSGRNVADLLDIIAERLEASDTKDEEKSEKTPNITIAGRPNVGKSSLLNALLGESRATVSEVPGTTRDAVDTPIEYDSKPYIIVDTAGIKKRYKYKEQLDFATVKRSEQAIQRSDIVLLVVDGSIGVTSDDQHLAQFIADEGKACIVIINKMDKVEDKEALTGNVEVQLRFLDYAPKVYISALTKKNMTKIFPLIVRVADSYQTRITTGQFNKFLALANEKQSPTVHKGKLLRIYYGTQIMVAPPTFQLFVNDPKAASTSYLRFLENFLREQHPFEGVPLKWQMKQRQ